MADFSIVGLGSSAGGLEALQKFFEAMPADSGLGFVVIAHLDPDHKSYLDDLLRQKTSLPVNAVTDAVEVAPNQVYVIAPDQELTIRNGVLEPHKPSEARRLRHPIDVLFRSLAEDQGERAIGVVLSGSGTNGAAGLRMIKGEGGIVVAQDPDTAGFEGMPHTAISTGLADLVLAPERMPEALIRLVRHPGWRHRSIMGRQDDKSQLERILTLLRARTKQDFRAYKRPTLVRRTRRRMALHQVETFGDYLDQLHQDPDEITALARDLTINVSGFFRDFEAWTELAGQAIKPLIAERDEVQLRIWVPACATGEEAYSLAMLVTEEAEAAAKSFEIQIFATDLAEDLLPQARTGLFPAGIVADVGDQRLKRFFDVEDTGYRIKKDLRERVMFAPQNLLLDPPFSRIDLISCRNLLIYLEPEYQKKVLGVFHFALRENGYLFLGPAESISGSEDLFQPISRKWRIYGRLGSRRHDGVNFPVMGAQAGREELDGAPITGRNGQTLANEQARQALLERYAPASVLIDRRHQIHYFHGSTENYLKPPSGAPTSNLLALAREGLEALLTSAVRQALESKEGIEANGRVKRGSSYHPIRLKITPLEQRGGEGRVLVSFFERETSETAPLIELDEATIDRQLREELKIAREELRLTLENSEASGEELKASNEEIRAMNEELRVANEELESSKEELQSLNEELNTVNVQLEAKVEELEGRTNDLNNLLNSTDIGTLFLDTDLRIRWFSPEMKNLLELLASDIGRPVYHFSPRFTGEDFVDDAKRVLATLRPSDCEVRSKQGRWYLRHVTPYRTETNRIEGVVVSFIDITEQRDGALRAKRLATVLEDSNDAVTLQAFDGRILAWNKGAERMYGYSEAEVLDLPAVILTPERRRAETENLLERAKRDELEPSLETQRVTKDGRVLDVALTMTVLHDADGKTELLATTERDITEQKDHERSQAMLIDELNHRVRNTLAIVSAIASQTLYHSESLETFGDSFQNRLQAFSKCHTLLSDLKWKEAALAAVIERQLSPYGEKGKEPISLAGPDIRLKPKKALALSLVIHELASNAVKYGALSNVDGKVQVTWRIEETSERNLCLLWTESGGPPVQAPTRRGFGAEVVEINLDHEFEGRAAFDFARDGLICEMIMPMPKAGMTL